MRRISSFVALAAAAALMTALVAGCSFGGIQAMQLPGTVGTGDGSLKVTVDLPDVGTLTPNGEVKVGDIAVGTVTKISTVDWHAVAEISLEPETTLPANAVARVGVNSLLGASYLELAPPADEPARGALATGAHITLDHAEAYPATEQVLSAASVVLNGGGLEQLSTITTELNKAFSGNGMAVRDLLPRVNSFVTSLDAQKEQIYGAIDSLDKLATRFANNRGTLTSAADAIGPALATLSAERPKLTAALTSLKKLSNVATPLVNSSRADLVGSLRDLVPTLRAINSAGDSLVRGFGFAVTFPFAPETVQNACRGDYCNLDLILDLTNETLVHGFTDRFGLPSLPGLPGLPAFTTIADLLNKLGLGPVVGGLGAVTGGLTGLLSPKDSKPAASAGSGRPTTPDQAAPPANDLENLLNSLLGANKRGATP